MESNQLLLLDIHDIMVTRFILFTWSGNVIIIDYVDVVVKYRAISQQMTDIHSTLVAGPPSTT